MKRLLRILCIVMFLTLLTGCKLISWKMTFKFETNGGSPINSTNQLVYEDVRKFEEPNKSTKKGYIIGGWYTDKELTKRFDIKDYPRGGKITLYAKWNPKTYKISYDLLKSLGLDDVNENPKAYNIESKTIVLKPIERAGYSFVGWFKKGTNEFVKEIKTGTTDDMTLIPEWVQEPFEENGQKYVYYGKYPQTLEQDENIINSLKKSSANASGYYTCAGSEYEYVKVVCGDLGQNKTSLNGKIPYVKGQEYFFRVEPIKWRIVSIGSETYQLVCDKVLFGSMFNSSTVIKTTGTGDDLTSVFANNYENSEIRELLNNEFLKVFTLGEKHNIQKVSISNKASTTTDLNNEYACNDTNDLVYALSFEELSTLLNNNLIAAATDYSIFTGASNTGENSSWMLRSPDSVYHNYVSYVMPDGTVSKQQSNAIFGIRPTMTIHK